MANIRKNKSGSYTATVYVGRDVNGKMLRRYVTRDGYKECKQAARELEQDVAAKDLSNVSMMKVNDYMKKWLDIYKPFLASTTYKSYKGYVNNHFIYFFDKMKMHQVTDMHIKSYLSEKLGKLSSTTVRKHFFVLQKMFRDALKHKSPCVGIKAPSVSDFTPTIPTEEEFEKIHSVFSDIGIEHEAIILLAGWCGVRRGEIFALKWDDIDSENGYIQIDEAMALKDDEYAWEYKDPKSKRGIRNIPAPDYLIQLLDKIKQNRKVIRHEVFSITPDMFNSKYRRLRDKGKIPRIRFHDLRHFHASILYKNNVPDLYAAERLGQDVWVLKKIYQHLGLKEKKEIDEKIKGLFK